MNNEAAKMLLLTCFSGALQQALGAERGSTWRCLPAAADPLAAMQAENIDVFAKGMRLRGTLHGEITMTLAQQDAGTIFAERDGDENKDLAGLWRQTMEQLAQCLPKRAMDEGRFAFSVESHGEIQPSDGDSLIGWIELRDTGDRSVMLQIWGDEELLSSLQVAEWNTRLNRTRPGAEAQLGRVIDVPLAVTLRFGQREMRLREVLELNTGSLVELDRQVEEPVDLLLGERVIARGEVVIVEGNYGLRVTEILECTPMSLF